MKSKFKKLFILFSLTIVSYSCTSGGHYHDGKYRAKMMFMEINYQIDGTDIIIDNSLTGISKLKCKQYPDRIEYIENDGTTRIVTALENGDLKFSYLVVLYKIDENQNLPAKQKSKKKLKFRNLEN